MNRGYFSLNVSLVEITRSPFNDIIRLKSLQWVPLKVLLYFFLISFTKLLLRANSNFIDFINHLLTFNKQQELFQKKQNINMEEN